MLTKKIYKLEDKRLWVGELYKDGRIVYSVVHPLKRVVENTLNKEKRSRYY